MATIERRTDSDGKASYRVKIRLKGHPPQTATFERLTDARKWVQATESAIREGRHFKTAESKRRTLTDAINRYRNTRTVDVDKSRHLNWWQERIGAYVLADVTASLISECREELAKGEYKRRGQRKSFPRTPSTCNRYLTSLSHVLSVASREWEWIEINP
jgi:hypothetical protein